MKYKILLCAILVATNIVFAQDIIVTKDAQKIEAKILEVSKSEIKYKEQDNLDGPIFILGTDEINSIIYANGKVVLYNQPSQQQSSNTSQSISAQVEQSLATTQSSTQQNKTISEEEEKIIYSAEEFHGDFLPRFTYKKVDVPGKKYQKRRYVGGNMVLTEKEFVKFLEMYCPEAYEYYRKGNSFLICEAISILLGLIPVIIFAIVAENYYSKVLPTYNTSCAGHHVAVLEVNPQDYFKDEVQLSQINF